METRTKNLKDDVESADEIFIAHVVLAKETVPASGDTEIGPPNVAVRYRLIKSIKGNPRQLGTIYTNYSSCSVSLLPGGEYVIFVRRDPEIGRRLVRSHLDGTRYYIASGKKDLEYVSDIQEIIRNPHKKNSR